MIELRALPHATTSPQNLHDLIERGLCCRCGGEIMPQQFAAVLVDVASGDLWAAHQCCSQYLHVQATLSAAEGRSLSIIDVPNAKRVLVVASGGQHS